MIRRAVLLVMMLSFAAPICQADNAPVISFFELMANKQRYDGKLVQLAGYLSFAFEDSAVYYGQADYSHQFTKNAIWVDTSVDKKINFKDYDQRYGFVVGVFSAKECGHLCLYNGGLKFVRFGLMYKDAPQSKSE